MNLQVAVFVLFQWSGVLEAREFRRRVLLSLPEVLILRESQGDSRRISVITPKHHQVSVGVPPDPGQGAHRRESDSLQEPRRVSLSAHAQRLRRSLRRSISRITCPKTSGLIYAIYSISCIAYHISFTIHHIPYSRSQIPHLTCPIISYVTHFHIISHILDQRS